MVIVSEYKQKFQTNSRSPDMEWAINNVLSISIEIKLSTVKQVTFHGQQGAHYIFPP